MPTPYGEVFFRSLHEAGFLHLVVHYNEEQVRSHPWKTDFCNGYESRICKYFLGIDWFLIKEALLNRRAVFIGGWGNVANAALITVCMLFRRNYILQSDTLNITRKRNLLFAAIRSLFLRAAFYRAGWAILYAGDTNIAAERFKTQGAPQEKLIHFPFWVDVDALRCAEKKVTSADSFLRFISIGCLFR